MSRSGGSLGGSQQYLNIAAYFDWEALPESADSFYRQSGEERMHAEKFVHYIVKAGGKVLIPAVIAPRADMDSAETAGKLSLEWELEVTKQINALMELAMQDKDHIGQQFLTWFVNEQLEEVSTMDQLLSVIRRAGQGGLLFVEDYLARRGNPHAEPAAAA